MRPRKLLFFAAILTLFDGCSQKNLEIEDLSSSPLSNQCISITKSSGTTYYYYFDKRIYLNEQPDIILLQFKDNISREKYKSGISSVSSMQLWEPGGKHMINTHNEHNILVLKHIGGAITPMALEDFISDDNILVASLLMESNGHYSAQTNSFFVKLKQSSDYPALEALSSEYHCDITQNAWSDPLEYFVSRPKDSDYESIELSDIFYETGKFEYTSPDFFVFDFLSTVDPLYQYQWNLHSTGLYGSSGIDINIEDAWGITEGNSSIKVAVLDNGVELIHQDIADNTLNGYDAVNLVAGGGPILAGDSHGTAVAGIISAKKDNGLGVSGIAPNCKILPVRILSGDYISDIANVVNGINWAANNGADIINCSWSLDNNYSTVYNALYNASIFGRSGKGCVVVASSGNNYVSDSGDVRFPASLPFVIAVGAVSTDGNRKTFSSPDGGAWSSYYGSSLNVVAPGASIPTTIRNSGYTYNFWGTSAAAPHVSGIAALILSKYPGLTSAQVRRSIETSCTRPSGYTYQYDGMLPISYRNDEVGYGVANAYDALLRAADANYQNVLDSIPAIDFVIRNNSSYELSNIYVGLTGTISGSSTTLISCDPGCVESGESVGFPDYRGEDLYDNPGTTISNISMELYAETPDCSGSIRIGAAVDTIYSPSYYSFSFGDGGTYTQSIASTTVPSDSRRTLYINIIDP